MTRALTVLEPDAAACCAGALASPLSRPQAEDLAALLKAVADPIRLQLVSIIRASANQEACVCDLTDAVGVAQPTVSHHLRILTQAGVLTRERRASWAWFTLVPQRLDDLASIFS